MNYTGFPPSSFDVIQDRSPAESRWNSILSTSIVVCVSPPPPSLFPGSSVFQSFRSPCRTRLDAQISKYYAYYDWVLSGSCISEFPLRRYSDLLQWKKTIALARYNHNPNEHKHTLFKLIHFQHIKFCICTNITLVRYNYIWNWGNKTFKCLPNFFEKMQSNNMMVGDKYSPQYLLPAKVLIRSQ